MFIKFIQTNWVYFKWNITKRLRCAIHRQHLTKLTLFCIFCFYSAIQASPLGIWSTFLVLLHVSVVHIWVLPLINSYFQNPSFLSNILERTIGLKSLDATSIKCYQKQSSLHFLAEFWSMIKWNYGYFPTILYSVYL